MKGKQCVMGWFAAICLAATMLVFTGCGGSGSPVPAVPAKPVNNAVLAGDTQATVSWTVSSDATSYNIYYGTTAGVTTSTGTKVVNATTPYTVTGLTNSTTYYFVVTAVNAAGESVVSTEVSATPIPPAPAKPAGIVASAGDSQVTVSWSAVTGATSYNIYYGTAAGVTTANGTKVANVTSPKVITSLTNNTPYFFVVTAVNAGGESGVSSEKTATPAAAPQPPGNPTGVTATPAAGQLTVAWNAVTVATSYNVYYLQSATAPSTVTVLNTGTKVASSSSPLVISGLASGTYYVSVTAVNAGGESSGQTSPKSAIVP